jgi:NitT/TauT family transport system substrate-binding protein
MLRLLALTAATVSALSLSAAAEEKMDKVSMGTTPTLAQCSYYIADAKGYLKEEHIETEAANFRGAQDAVSAMATGELDVNLGAINAGFLNAMSQGVDYRAVAALGIQPLPVTATPLIARKDLWDSGTLRTGADLKGRKVAVNTPGASPEYFLSLVLQRHGMTLKDVDETMIGFPQMVIALQNKSVDAAFPAEPFATLAIKQGNAELVNEEASIGGGDMTTVFFFSGKFIRERPAVGVRFLRALIRGVRECQGFYTKNPQIVAILAKATHIAPETIEAAVPYGFDPDLDIGKYLDSIRRQERQHMKDGRINYKDPVPMDHMVNVDLVHKAAVSLIKH